MEELALPMRKVIFHAKRTLEWQDNYRNSMNQFLFSVQFSYQTIHLDHLSIDIDTTSSENSRRDK
jgi:hypothetical protein